MVDASGGRWLFPTGEAAKDASPRSRDGIDEGALLGRYFEPNLGFLALAADGSLLGADDPLGALRLVASLPKGTKPSTLRFFRGGITYFGEAGPELVGTDGKRRPVGPMPGHVVAEALIGADGAGVGLFFPEAVGVTKDFGGTWTRVDTAGVRVESLRVQNGAPLLVPGGVRDGFPRSVDLDNGKLARVVEELGPDERRDRSRRRRDRRSRWDGDFRSPDSFAVPVPEPPAAPVRTRLSPKLALSGRRGGPAVGDGDRVVDFRSDPSSPSRLLMNRGRIGEALEPYGEGALGECVLLAAATCGERTAVLCGEKLHLFRGNDTVLTVAVPLGTQVGFDQAGGLISVVDDEETRTVSLRRWSDDFTPGPPEAVPGLTRGPLTILGGCGGPALWIEGGGVATRFDQGARAFEPPVDLPPDAMAFAVSHDRSLVASNGSDLLFFPAATIAPLGLHQPGYLGFTRSGRHALYVAPSGQVQQSDDGGRSFSPIATPATRGRLPVLCGDDRCQLGEGAWREGFGRDAQPIAAWPDPPVGPGAGRRADRRPVAPPPEAVSMTCRADAALFADMESGVLLPRLGAWLAEGVSMDERAGFRASFADATGKATTTALAPARKLANGDIGVGPGVVVTTTWGIGRQNVSALYRWEPTSQPVRVDPFGSEEPSFVSEEGFAVVDFQRGDLVLWGKQKPSRRAFSGSARSSAGVLHVEPDGTWLVGDLGEQGELRLVAVPELGRNEDRTLTLSGRETVERGVGFLPGNERKIVLLEPTDDGGSELRIRAVSPTLAFGEAAAVPGTRTAKGRLLDLPSCAPGANGALVEARSTEARAIQLDGHRLVRRIARALRVTPTSACVERTYVPTTNGRFHVELVVAGNGGVAVGGDTPAGFRCSPLDTAPPTPPAVPAPTAEP